MAGGQRANHQLAIILFMGAGMGIAAAIGLATGGSGGLRFLWAGLALASAAALIWVLVRYLARHPL